MKRIITAAMLLPLAAVAAADYYTARNIDSWVSYPGERVVRFKLFRGTQDVTAQVHQTFQAGNCVYCKFNGSQNLGQMFANRARMIDGRIEVRITDTGNRIYIYMGPNQYGSVYFR